MAGGIGTILGLTSTVMPVTDGQIQKVYTPKTEQPVKQEIVVTNNEVKGGRDFPGLSKPILVADNRGRNNERNRNTNNQQDRFQFTNREQQLHGITDTRRQAVETGKGAQERIDENNLNINRRNQGIRGNVNQFSDTNPLDLLNNQ